MIVHLAFFQDRNVDDKDRSKGQLLKKLHWKIQ